MITAQIFRCDRDGVEAPGDETGNAHPGEPPRGWSQISVSGKPPVGTLNGHLCPDCNAAFQAFMAEGGSRQGRRHG